MQNLLETEIMCFCKEDHERNERLGLDEKPAEQWMKITIDLNGVIAVRENLDEDGKPQCTIYLFGTDFTVKGEYNEIRNKWISARWPKKDLKAVRGLTEGV